MDTKTHLLARLTSSIPVPDIKTPPTGGVYDELLGLWVDQKEGAPLVYDPNRPRPQTKKADVETGEDNKGT